MNSLPPPIPPPPISRHPGPPSNDDSNFTGPLRYDRLAIASLVSGIASCLNFWPRAGLLHPSVLAFVLGILALRRIKAEPKRLKGRGMALAGMIIPPLLILVSFIKWFLSGGPNDMPW